MPTQSCLPGLSAPPVLVPPVTHHGGKLRYASHIWDVIVQHHALSGNTRFVDVCCGSGAVTFEAIRRGIPPGRCLMIDAGPYGLVWEAIAHGQFDMDRLGALCDQVPSDMRQVHDWLVALSKQPVDVGHPPFSYGSAPYVYLLLQSGAWGGKQVGIRDGCWLTPGFGDYWVPQAISLAHGISIALHVSPDSLKQRMEHLVAGWSGIRAWWGDAASFDYQVDTDTIIYIDPPYEGTTRYADSFDWRTLAGLPCDVFVSERKPLGLVASLLPRAGRSGVIAPKAGVPASSTRQEWVTLFR